MKFEWDADKEKANIKNHDGISFYFASKVFNDIWAIDEFDEVHSTDKEKRFTIIGFADGKLLRVTFTVADDGGEELIRLISARKALGKDKESYERARKELDISND